MTNFHRHLRPKSAFFALIEQTIKAMPVRAIIKTLELECRMFEEDLRQGRAVPADEVLSLLNFYQFILTAKAGSTAPFGAWEVPVQHLPFYRGVLDRLIAGKELSVEARTRFLWLFPEACPEPEVLAAAV